jgi:hypothetical protein
MGTHMMTEGAVVSHGPVLNLSDAVGVRVGGDAGS